MTAGYKLGLQWDTSVGLTPDRTSSASDYDTFFDPGGTTWVSGTTGDAIVHSVRFTQRAQFGRIGRVILTGGYRFRMDVANFLPSFKTVTENGAVVEAMDVTTHEYTTGQLHEVFLGVSIPQQISRRWRLTLDADTAPGAIGRLAVQLPEKYPGETVVLRTTALTTSAGAAIATTDTRWPISVSADFSRAWNYRSDGTIVRDGLGARVTLGRTW